MLKIFSKSIAIIIIALIAFISILLLINSIKVGEFKFSIINSVIQFVIAVWTIIMAIRTLFAKYFDEWKVKQGIIHPSRKWKDLNYVVNEAHKWINKNENKELIRTQQKLTLTLSRCGINAIKIERSHTYCIYNPKADESYNMEKVKVSTDLGTYKKLSDMEIRELRKIDSNADFAIDKLDKRGGFTSIKINNSNGTELTELAGSDLLLKADHNGFEIKESSDNTRLNFVKENVKIPAKGSVNFEFHAFGVYRLSDKFLWVFNQFSDGLILKVIKNDGPKKIRYRTIHHEATPLTDDKDKVEKEFEINHPIFPNQGFEIRWEYDKQDKNTNFGQ